jgi:type IX secretion system substrate protein
MKRVVLFCFLILFMYLLSAQEIQLAPCDDMYTDCIPNGPAHNEGDLFLVYESAAEIEQIMLKFDLSGIQGIEIESSTLNLHRNFACGGGGGTTTAMIYLINEDWNEETWDPHTFVQCDSTSGFAFTFSGPTGDQNIWFEVDLSDYVDLWLYANQPNFGLVIVADMGQRHSKFDSKEAANADFQPYLNLVLPTEAGNVLENSIISLSNYPNPFNPSTTISFDLIPEYSEKTELVIYNIYGQQVREYSISSDQTSLVWNGMDKLNHPVSSGVYFYKIKSGVLEKTNKMVLMK